ncbi:hypothetical protein CAPTEDRAFT_195506 [Capitella teleta]|uniref:Uncharacterized protein n=1 Tax=Capitella teleta TaxID=283909 RepID=R7VBY3_CAPTE|nr:hypothetical protein CAPTEDRAFT_195506 [Capitella teleta]|eukprot:ELU13821.1 hypothetical protein CAPTEDRAFT_195506 [Capitella teleta]
MGTQYSVEELVACGGSPSTAAYATGTLPYGVRGARGRPPPRSPRSPPASPSKWLLGQGRAYGIYADIPGEKGYSKEEDDHKEYNIGRHLEMTHATRCQESRDQDFPLIEIEAGRNFLKYVSRWRTSNLDEAQQKSTMFKAKMVPISWTRFCIHYASALGATLGPLV